MRITTTTKNISGIPYLSAERYIVTILAAGYRYKIFQVLFNKKDGSLHISFPYFIHKEGLLSEATIPAKTTFPTDLSLLPGGKVTTHRVKYSHHVSGEALFSQDGKIYSKIRKRSVPLKSQAGHIFTVLICGIPSFEKASDLYSQVSSGSRTVLTFEFQGMPQKVKFVGMWYSIRLIRKNSIGVKKNVAQKPLLLASNGTVREGLLLLDPFLESGEKYALVLCSEIIPGNSTKESLAFMGGFDPPELVYNHNRETKMLSLIYPAYDADNLANQIGSIDFTETPNIKE
jgi:hypothetical protein